MTNGIEPPADQAPVFCARCAVALQPGSGIFYRITIEAVADPTPPTFSAEDLAIDVRPLIEQLLAQLDDLSEAEALAQVYRRLILDLCGRCYREWIENPTG
jgi:hypothetical protein